MNLFVKFTGLIFFIFISPFCYCQSEGPTEIEFLRDLLYFKDYRNYTTTGRWDLEDYVIGRFAEIGSPAAELLIECVKDHESPASSRADAALKKINDPKVESILEGYLDYPEPIFASRVIQLLKQKTDSVQKQDLLEEKKKEHGLSKPYEIQYLGKISKQEILSHLIKLLDDPSWEKRRYAVGELLLIQEKEQATESLIKVVNDDGKAEINAYRMKIEEEQKEEDESAPRLEVEMFKEDILFCRIKAAIALGQIGTEKSLRALQDLLESREEADRIMAIRALHEYSNPQVINLITPALNGQSIYVRCMAYELLAQYKTPESIDLLIKGTGDSNPEIRGIAIKLLSEFQDSALIDVYKEILNRHKDLSIIPTIKALAATKDPSAADYLLEYLFREDTSFYGDIISEALKSFGETRITEFLLAKLESSDEDVKITALRALGILEDPAAIPALRACLNDNEYFVRDAAADAISHFDDKNLRNDLIAAVKNPDPWIPEGIVKALGGFRDDEVVSLLTGILLGDESFSVRAAAAGSLGKIGKPACVDALIKGMKDKDDVVRRSCAKALGDIGNPRAVDVLIHALDTEGILINGYESGDLFVCSAAGEALSHIDAPDLNKKLISLFRSKNVPGRIEAVLLLVRRGWRPSTLEEWIDFDIAAGLFDVVSEKGTAAVEPLIATTKEENWIWKGGAAKALGVIGDERAVEPLIDVLNSTNWPRSEAAKALMVFKDKRAIKPLIHALESDDWHIRADAASALGVYDEKETIEALNRAAQDSHPRVRDAAKEALKSKAIN